MIHYIKGNLLDTHCNYICHQVNCQGKMGNGVAKAIRGQWPKVYENYMAKFKAAEESLIHNRVFLGDIQIVALYENYNNTLFRQYVVNMFAQYSYGYNSERYTSYDAFDTCLQKMVQTIPPEASIAFPYKIGCGLGGADWQIIKRMIELRLGDREVYFYYIDDKIFEER